MLQQLERRQLFAGGIDSSFGSANGAAFQAPGQEAYSDDSAVDRYGRVVIAGFAYTADSADPVMTLGRLDAQGLPDTTFGVNGLVSGTPKGTHELAQVVALRNGGYVGVAKGIGAPYRLLAFSDNGRINRSFGRDAVASLDGLRATQLLEQADGKLIVVGAAQARTDDVSGRDFNYAVRFLPTGQIDTSYGDAGWVSLGLSSQTIGGVTTQTDLTSASLNSNNKLLLAFVNTETTRDSITTAVTKLATSTYFKRLDIHGNFDAKFVGKTVQKDSNDQGTDGVDILTPVTVTRGDGQVVLITRDETNSNLTISLRGAYGQLGSDRAPSFPVVLPGNSFVVDNLADGAIVATDDNKIVVAGSIIEGSAKTPALFRLDADLRIDGTFGTNGLMRLPTTDNSIEASNVTRNADGTLTALVSGERNGTSRPGSLRAVQIFQDDQPVVSYQGVKGKNGVARVSVAIRGINPIDLATIDALDLRLIDESGARSKGRLFSVVASSDGDYRATYGFSKISGAFSVVTVGGQIGDTDDHTNASETIGSFVL